MLQYRLALPEDADAIADLHAESWRGTYRGEYRAEFLDGPVFADRRVVWRSRLGQPAAGQFVCLAVEAGRLIGFVCAFGGHDPEWGSLIDNLHVSDEAKRRGVGASLMSRAGAWLLEHYPEQRVHLLVLVSNRGAQAFYDRLGGRNVGQVEEENPGGGSSDLFRYVWDSPRPLADVKAPT